MDNIYVVSKESGTLLYSNKTEVKGNKNQKCYKVVYGQDEPCEFCISCPVLGKENTRNREEKEIQFDANGHTYLARCTEVQWEGKPAFLKYVRDITTESKEKKRLEQYFEMILQHLPGGVTVVKCDVQNRLTFEFCSAGFLEMTEMTEAEARQIYAGDELNGIHPDDQKYVKENLMRCLSKECDCYELQYRIRKGKSSYLWVNAKYSLIESSNDRRIYINYHDITEEKKRQEQLREQYNELIFHHYLMTGSDVLMLGHCNITKNKILAMVDNTNSGILEKFGNVREEFFTGVGTFIPDKKERDLFYSKYLNEPSRKAFQNGITEVLMFCYIQLPEKKEGKYAQFQVNLVAAPDTGDITGILTVTDITEKVIRDKIFTQLSSTNYDLVVDVNLFQDTYRIVNGGDWDIPDTEGVFSERLGKVKEKVISREKDYFEMMTAPDQILEHLNEKGVYSFSYSCKNYNGEIVTKNMRIAAIDLRLGRICLVRSDITEMLVSERKEKKKLEQALEEARTANRVKSDFLSSMSHDIRTPMNAIMGMTTLALKNIDDQNKVRDYLKKISVSSQHLLSLINDILDMSQIEHNKIQLNESSVCLEELLSHLSSIMTLQAQNAGLHFEMRTENLTHSYFVGDALRLKQIFINLLSNAFKFTLEGGNVWFLTEEIPPHKKEMVRYRFTVRDTGIGMSEEFMEHLFEPFIRSKKVSRVEGTGLGLSITKGLVDLMDGQIFAESSQGEGTTFYIELEFAQGTLPDTNANTVQKETREQKQSLEGFHFLLVEDNEINSEILGELLQMWGAEFTIKRDGLQAVEEFKRAKPGTYDAIFMDIQMPVMNGYEATRAIRSLHRPDARSVLILAMTANAFAEDVQSALNAGMNHHIAKPLDANLLYSTLTEMLHSKK